MLRGALGVGNPRQLHRETVEVRLSWKAPVDCGNYYFKGPQKELNDFNNRVGSLRKRYTLSKEQTS